MASEAETAGREAVLGVEGRSRHLQRRVTRRIVGRRDEFAGDRNLGIYEIGGEKATSRSAVVVDERANPVQRMALVAMSQRALKRL